MLGIGNSVNVVYVKVIDIYGADAVAKRLSVLLNCEAKSWSSGFPSFVTSLQAQSASAYLISGFTLIASSFAIASVLIVSVQRKAKQIGILKSIGARSNQILLVFLLEGLGIAVAGSVMGAIAGIAVVYLLSLRRMTEAGALPLRPHQREFPLWTLPTRRQAGDQAFLPSRAKPFGTLPLVAQTTPAPQAPV